MDKLLTTQEAADSLRLSAKTLQSWRVLGGGPRFVKAGGRVFYRDADLCAWLEKRVRASTSDDGPGLLAA